LVCFPLTKISVTAGFDPKKSAIDHMGRRCVPALSHANNDTERATRRRVTALLQRTRIGLGFVA
jgi:hypothetical protein